MTPVRGKQVIERILRVGPQLGQVPAAGDEAICGECAWPASIGHNGEMRAARTRLLGEQFRHVEQFANGVHAQHSRAPERGIEHGIAAGERAGVRGSSFRGGFGVADFENDDGFGQSNFTRGGHERPRVPHGLHVADDALGVRVVAEVRDEVAPADIEHGADRDKRAEAHILAKAPVEHRRAKRPALAEECDAARLGHALRERRVEPRVRHHQAETVGPEQPHLRPPRFGETLLLQFCACLAAFPEARRDDDGRRHTRLRAFADDTGHRRRGCGDNGEVHFLLHGVEVREGVQTTERLVVGIDREHPAFEDLKVLQERLADAAGPLRCADDRDVSGGEHRGNRGCRPPDSTPRFGKRRSSGGRLLSVMVGRRVHRLFA